MLFQKLGCSLYHPLGVVFLEGVLLGLFALAVALLTKGLWNGPSRDDLDAAEKSNRAASLRSVAQSTPPDLERRAILHKRWMMVGHDSQFKKAGDYRAYTIAEVPFFIIRDKDGCLRAFHNVCRHRAYTVVRKACGNSLRLACKYHGWQYQTNGQLIKAPQFMEQQGFDPASNGLFEIHLRLDSSKFIFVNLATHLLDSFPWSDTGSPLSLDFDSVSEEWEDEVNIGWRLASLLPWFVNPTKFTKRTWRDAIVTRLMRPRPFLQYVDDGSFICDFGDGCFLLVSALPASGKKTVVKCTYISSPGKVQRRNVRSLAGCEITLAIQRLSKFRAANTTLDCRQSAVRERWDKLARHIDQHRSMEKRAGRKINPIIRVTGHEATDVEAAALCDRLEADERRVTERLNDMEKALDW